MRSIHQSLNITHTESRSSIYSPTTCPIFWESYHTADEICLSSNEEWPHAFHLQYIQGWLMDNDARPICSASYLSPEDEQSL